MLHGYFTQWLIAEMGASPHNVACYRDTFRLSVDTGTMARGLRLIIGALVDDLVFNGTKGEIVLTMKEIKQAIEQVVSLANLSDADGILTPVVTAK